MTEDQTKTKWLAEELMGWAEVAFTVKGLPDQGVGWMNASGRVIELSSWNPLDDREDWADCEAMLDKMGLGPFYARWRVQYQDLAAAQPAATCGVFTFIALFELVSMDPRCCFEAVWANREAVEFRLNNLPEECRLYRQVDVSAMPMWRGREPQQESTTITEGNTMPRESKVVQRAEACVAFLKANPSDEPVKADYFERMVTEQGEALGLKEGKSEAQIERALRYARKTLGALERCRGGGYKLGDDSPNDGGAAQAEQAEAAEKAAESASPDETPVQGEAVEAFDPNAAAPDLIPDR